MLLFSLTLLQASAACLVTGLLLWALLSLAQRRWPALAAQRSVWLGAQLVLVAVFVLPLLPDTRQLSVVPELSVPVSLAGSAPGVQLAMAAPAAGLPSAASWLAWVPSAWGLIYLLGVACAAWRWQRGHAMLRSLLQLAQRRRLHGVDVLEVAAPISPMLVGVWQPRLLLPAHLAQFTPEQQQLVIAHELTHARRRDPVLLLLTNMLQALLWFNPAARWLAGRPAGLGARARLRPPGTGWPAPAPAPAICGGPGQATGPAGPAAAGAGLWWRQHGRAPAAHA